MYVCMMYVYLLYIIFTYIYYEYIIPVPKNPENSMRIIIASGPKDKATSVEGAAAPIDWNRNREDRVDIKMK